MSNKVIEYTSAVKVVEDETDILETIDKDGIVCTWRGRTFCAFRMDQTHFSWNFDWSELKNEGVERITGYLILKGTVNDAWRAGFGKHKIDIDLKETPKTVTKEFEEDYYDAEVTFKYRLTLHYPQKIDTTLFDEMFAASEMNDTVLVIEGKKVHVNKVFLSYHSEFFRALFSSNFKEGQMAEIPIKDVTYEDFGLLMSTIYPKQVFPTDETSEKLLELADRFLMPGVTHIVEFRLLEHCQLDNMKMLYMADVYRLPKLLEKAILSMDTVEEANALEKSEEYEKLSDGAKARLFKRIVQLV